eukprot:TRINITY_DN34137_c0_g1_i1.p1 TRINITY_DN34137_c0_g1~~TRINITY_DN34137_c0_g1_i1.p1  ORF type:complete len:113 (-),score=28.52 TRINITY_DN34137_c0_g1_i1:47-385(-)
MDETLENRLSDIADAFEDLKVGSFSPNDLFQMVKMDVRWFRRVTASLCKELSKSSFISSESAHLNAPQRFSGVEKEFHMSFQQHILRTLSMFHKQIVLQSQSTTVNHVNDWM